MPAFDVTARDITQARQRVMPLAVRTPLINSLPLTEHAGASVILNLESVQETGWFKIRGAANKLLSLSSEQRSRAWSAATAAIFKAQALFVSGIVLSPITAALEDDLGRSVFSTNMASMWHALWLAGVQEAQPGWGALSQLPNP
mgnify:CR=1 FL=1